jgi:hypothetical protein
MKVMFICAVCGMGMALWEHDFSEAMWAMWTAVLAYERIESAKEGQKP